MALNFTIIVKGISLSYYKNGAWGFIFPFDDCHNLKLKTDEDDPGISLAGPNRRISISLERPESDSQFPSPDEEDHPYFSFLDMTHNNSDSDHIHNDGITMRRDWNERGVLLRIRNAGFTAGRISKKRFFVASSETWKLAKRPDFIGLTGVASLFAEDGGALVIRVQRKIGIDIDGQAIYEDISNHRFEKSVSLILDNDCNIEAGGDVEGDFHMLYWVVQDSVDRQVQYTVMREILPNHVLQMIAARNMEIAQISPNVVPFINGPFSGKFVDSYGLMGLPCYKVRVSDADNLPSLDFAVPGEEE